MRVNQDPKNSADQGLNNWHLQPKKNLQAKNIKTQKQLEKLTTRTLVQFFFFYSTNYNFKNSNEVMEQQGTINKGK